MELPQRPNNNRGRARKCLCIGLPMLVVALLLVIIVPTAVILKKDHDGSIGLPATVLLPLYLYPTDDAWEPLYKAIEKAPKLNFTVIVNPNNGPGGMTDLMHFKPALQKPAAFPNVQTIGYVPTENGTRATTAVQRDVLQYSVWSNMPLNCTLNGIFFDETPYVRGNQTEGYLTIINGCAKGANGIESPKTIIHKPAGIPDYGSPLDAVTVFEDPYSALGSFLNANAPASPARGLCSFMINSVPESASMTDLVKALSKRGKYLFATDLAETDGKSFGGRWEEFVDAMEETA